MTEKLIDGIDVMNALLCEDLRAEQNGKWTILGVFSGNIIVAEIPANLRLAIYVELRISKEYKGPLILRILLNGNECAKMVGEIDAKVGYSSVPIPTIIVGLAAAGVLTVEMSSDDKNWTEIISRELLVGKFKDGIFISSSEQPQPSEQS